MIKIKKLNSGVRMVMEDMSSVQSVSIGIWVRTGAVNETQEHSGISHFIEHMMFKGTQTRSAKQIAGDIDAIGGQINAFTGKEATCYYVKAIYDNYEKAADVLVDMLTNSIFDKKEMNKERSVICEEIKMTQDDPDDLAHDTVTSLVFKGAPLGKSIIGTPGSLKKINRDVMTQYIADEYTRDSIVVSVAGKFDEAEICSYFEEKFSALKAGKKREKYCIAPYKESYKVITKDIEQSHICLATKGIPQGDDRYYAFSVVNNVMGGSMSSRLFQNIREEKGLAYSVYSMLGSFSNDGYYNIYAGIGHDKVKDAVVGIKDELGILGARGITEEELESSKAQLKSSYIFSQESVSGRMFKNGKNAILTGRVYEPEEIVRGFNEVKMDDVEEIKKLICDFGKYSAVLVTKDKVDLKKIMRG